MGQHRSRETQPQSDPACYIFEAMARYRADVLDELKQFGLLPTPETPPELVREQLNDLYCYELRRLRDRRRAGEFPKHEYADRVRRLREKYRLLSRPLWTWIERA